MVQQLLEVCLGEVGDTNVLHLARVEQLLHLPPCINKGPIIIDLLLIIPIHGSRPVHQVQIQVIRAQVLQALLQTVLNVLVAVVVELGGQPDLVSGHARGLNAFANILLVAVGGSGVDVAVSLLEGGLDGGGDLVGGGLPGAEADGGDLCAGVESVGAAGSVGQFDREREWAVNLRGLLGFGHGG